MKITLIVLSILMTLHLEASTKGPCRFDLVGPNTLPDAILEDRPMSASDCRNVALKTLELNKVYYDKVIIKDVITGKMTVVTLDGKENE